ncbi:hypothetical protein CPT12_28320, partial [Klebsiella pneumoniae]
DVALVLGPGNPPTLAVLAWQWLSQGDELQQAKGALASLLLMTILGGLDVALVLGPGNPPTLAVLAWQWLSQGDELQQAKG